MSAPAPTNGLLRQAAERVQALEGLEEVLFSRLLAAKRPVVIAVLAVLFLVLLGVQLWFIVTGFDDALDILLWFTLTAILALSFSLAMAWRWSGALYRRLENLETSLKQRARYDSLTGLPNRAYFMKRLAAALGLARERGDGLALLLIDLDNFLIVNGALGHEAGDALLRAVGERFAELAPGGDTLGRLGGDEYAILVAPADAAEAEALANRVIQALVRPVVVLDQPIYLGASVGIALFPQDAGDAETLLRCADTAMYQAKENGKNTHQFYSEALNLRTLQHFAIDASLRKALEGEELALYYQPQVDVETRAIVGVEALLRWKSAEHGTFASGDFITIAEQSGLINQLGAWAIEAACRQARDWQLKGLADLTVSVNLSARQFHTCDVVRLVRDTLERTGLDPRLLELEITESVLLKNNADILDKLDALTRLGVKLAIDDFGTGYSAMAYLKRLPIHRLKIDKSFVRDIHTTSDDAAIAIAIIGMAVGLGIEVTAEGVENEEQLDFLKRAGCHLVQGYYFGSPLPADELEHLLRQTRQPITAADRQVAVPAGPPG